jgi:hypothetical protein
MKMQSMKPLFYVLTALAVHTGVWAESANVFCQKNAAYFAEFYAGLYKMNSHGLKNFTANSADQQAYFVQVTKNGEKLESNINKGINNDNSLSAQDKSSFLHITHLTGEKLRQLAATDAMNDTFKEKEAVLKELLTVCVNTNQQ